jgi:hypothetical protein
MTPKSKPKSKTIKPTKETKTVKEVLPKPRKWAKCHSRYITPELRRRGLPTWGHQTSLIARLKATDPPNLRTPDARKATHSKQLKRFQNAALKNITPFPFFCKLPLEIRERIWEFSLPGPRVLALDTSRKGPVPVRLFFSPVFKTRNPAALTTCRESRVVAKRRYKLAFGTPNVYFDFEGGDILYFSPECSRSYGRFLDEPWEWFQGWIWGEGGEPRKAMAKLNEEVVRDLESVRHLAIARELWNSTWELYAWFGYAHTTNGEDNATGDLLRKRLRRFKALERISLEYGKERWNHESTHEIFCGGLVIEDPWFEQRPFDSRPGQKETLSVALYKEHVPKLEEWLEMDGRWEVTGDLNAVALLSRFDTKDLSDEEKEKGIPEARLVNIKFVTEEPRRVREELWRNWGWQAFSH